MLCNAIREFLRKVGSKLPERAMSLEAQNGIPGLDA